MGITDRGGAEANNRFWFRARLARRTELHGCDGRCSCWHCIGCGYCRGGCVSGNERGNCMLPYGQERMGQCVGAERGCRFELCSPDSGWDDGSRESGAEGLGWWRCVARRRSSSCCCFCSFCCGRSFAGRWARAATCGCTGRCGCSSSLIRWRRWRMRWRPMRSIAVCCGA